MHKHKRSKLLTAVPLILIIIYGAFKPYILGMYARLTKYGADILGLENSLQILRDQALDEGTREETLGWPFYYPTYYLLHILFIHLLFKNNPRVRNLLIIGLTLLLTLLVCGWVLFNGLGMPQMGSFFRNQFRHLFGLPFILLIIEGGRILYQDFIKLRNNQ